MELVVLPVTASAIDCTAQVVKSRGWLFTLLLLANREVIPGVCGGDLDLSRLPVRLRERCQWLLQRGDVGVDRLPGEGPHGGR